MSVGGRPRGAERPATSAGKVKVNLLISRDLADEADRLAERTGTRTSGILNQAIVDGLAIRRVREQAAEQAIAAEAAV